MKQRQKHERYQILYGCSKIEALYLLLFLLSQIRYRNNYWHIINNICSKSIYVYITKIAAAFDSSSHCNEIDKVGVVGSGDMNIMLACSKGKLKT